MHLSRLGSAMMQAIAKFNAENPSKQIPYVGTNADTALGTLYPLIYIKTLVLAHKAMLNDRFKLIGCISAKLGTAPYRAAINMNRRQKAQLNEQFTEFETYYKGIPIDSELYNYLIEGLLSGKLFNSPITDIENPIVVPTTQMVAAQTNTVIGLHEASVGNGFPTYVLPFVAIGPFLGIGLNEFNIDLAHVTHAEITRTASVYEILRNVPGLDFEKSVDLNISEMPTNYEIGIYPNYLVARTINYPDVIANSTPYTVKYGDDEFIDSSDVAY